jgi:hypothetical protein
MRYVILGLAVIALHTAPFGGAAEPAIKSIEIPLERVWALDMPDTRSVRDLEPDIDVAKLSAAELAKRSLVTQIGMSLLRHPDPKENEAAGKGFAVAGDGLAELQPATSVIADGKERPELFGTNDSITLAFYSFPTKGLVQLETVRRLDKSVTISFRIVPQAAPAARSHFALIPLGRLPPAKYSVDLRALPLDERFVDAGIKPMTPAEIHRSVCESFSFLVRDLAPGNASK